MNKINLMFLFFFGFSLLVSAGGDSSASSSTIIKGPIAGVVDNYLERIAPYGFSGAVLVAKKGEIILANGYGMAIRSKGIPNTAETVLNTGSITKQFSAAAIMKLEMQGKLNTNDKITKFFKNVPEDKKNITLHHLLNHSSGIVDAVGDDYVKAERDETVTKILKAPLQFSPGEEFSYSNAGYSLLAAVIEKVSGKNYETFLHEQLFEPAGMQFTGYRIPRWNRRVVAHWYVGNKDNGTPLEKPYPYWNVIGNGEILSTLDDMYKWHLALLGNKILSEEAKKKIFTPYLNDYGYGWDVLKSDHGILIQHDGGSGLGSSAEIRRYIDADVVTILFCNQGYGRRALFRVIRDKLETLVFGGNVNIPPETATKPYDELKRFCGTYSLSGQKGFDIKWENDRLLLMPLSQQGINVLFLGDSADAGSVSNLHYVSESIFKAALKGDFKPFASVLANKEKRAERVREFIDMRIQRYRQQTGNITGVFAVHTLPSQLNGEPVLDTTVRLKGEKGSIYFRLFWKNGENVGVAPLMRPESLSLPILPVKGNRDQFAGYHLPMARTTRLTFKIGSNGKVKGVIIHHPQKEHMAKKEF